MIPRHLQIAVLLLIIAVGGAGIYILRMQDAEMRRGSSGSTTPIAAPTAATERVTLALAYDDDAALRRQEFNLALPPEPTERAREMLRALLAEYQKQPSPHPMPQGADVRDVYLMPDESGRWLAVVDVNTAFVEAHRSGILVENLTIASMVNSLHLNLPQIRAVKFLVEGEERHTLAGHADLSMDYTPDAVRQLALEVR